ncbi:MAG: stalk domain-containing protein [Bacillota bacterium]|nr:stalk domain-containing protein [Bacillota bacterium]
MKKLVAVFLAFSMLLAGSSICFAETDMVLTLENISSKSDSLTLKAVDGKLCASMVRDQYVMFKNLNFSSVKSVKITGTADFMGHHDSDILELRLDSINGPLAGYVDFDKEGKDQTFGVNVNVSGTHDLYIASVYSADSASVSFHTVTLSMTAVKKDTYVPCDESFIKDTYSDTWSAVDGLGRSVADYEEVGSYNPEKKVGLFYHTWHTDIGSAKQIINNSEWYRQYPEIFAEDQFKNPKWPGIANEVHFWDEPMFGYYMGIDYWVYRKHAELLSAIGVDFLYFDCSNGSVFFRENMLTLCKAFEDSRKDGNKTPQIAVMSNLSYPVKDTIVQLEALYLTFYKEGLYSDLWYYHDGKPLILAHEEALTSQYVDKNDPVESALINEISGFFTFRGIKGDYKNAGEVPVNKWKWAGAYPQTPSSAKNDDGTSEMVPALFTANKSYVTNDYEVMSGSESYTKATTVTFGKDFREGAYIYDYHFEEQMAGALATNAKILTVGSWNEWQMGRFETYEGSKNAFVDLYKDDTTRDVEPSKGNNKDYGYMLLADSIRKWKGVRPVPTATQETTISMSDITSWDNVGPEYVNQKGIYNRDYDGYCKLHYTNYTARNNVISSKAARNSENLWFYAKTSNNLTPATDSMWMRLYINSDRNHATGWEGYDYRINGIKAGSFERWENGTWVSAGTVQYTTGENTLVIKIPRSYLAITGQIDFDFKWVDNCSDSDIMNFYVDGNAAPLGRFNYRYTEKPLTSISSEQRAQLADTTIIRAGSGRAIVNGGKMFVYEPDTRYGVRVINNVAYMPVNILKDALGFGTTKITYDNTRNILKIFTPNLLVYTVVGSMEARYDGEYRALTNEVVLVDGIPYIPITFMQECYGKEVYYTKDGAVAFGKSINKDTADAVSNQV